MGNRIKRKAMYNYFKDHQLDIVFMQEVHCTKKTSKLWEQEWGNGKWLVSSDRSNSRGCVIMFKNSKIKVINHFTDHEGRYIIANIVIDEVQYTLCNLYAPNEDSPNFFNSMLTTLEKRATGNIVIGGDFNLVMNPNLDRKNQIGNNHKAHEILNTFVEVLDLSDVWRIRNPEKRAYTWFKRNPNDTSNASRIDMFLTNTGVANKANKVSITSNCRTDHSMITMEIVDNDLQRGPGVWKFNDKLLLDQRYVEDMSKRIEQVKENISRSNMNATKKWEHLKIQCREFTIAYTKGTSGKKKALMCNLNKLRNLLLNESTKQRNDETLNQITNKIKSLELEQTQSSIYRSRSNWINAGEKMSKYFLSLEKRNYNNKVMKAIFLKDGTICTHQKRILQEQITFYKNLFTTNTDVNFDIENNSGVTLNETQRDTLEKEFSFEEIRTSLFSMARDKVPGCDGLTVAYYITFFELLKDDLWSMIQYVLNTSKKFGNSSRKGLISLIPKKNRDSRYLKNARPLTLLCTDFKILAKAMALRLKSVLPDIIGNQQNGFMSGRNIQDNIVTTMDIVSHIYQSGKKAVIITIDFEKCFDRLEHESIFAAMRYFKFGPKFISWSKIFFNKLFICTQNAGYQSEFAPKTRGVNQGCNFSPFCFLICSEIMTHLIKSNPYIKGIKVGKSEVENIISQFADDTALFLMYTEKCINETLSTLARFEDNTGLKISYEKTCIYRIGSLKNSEAKCYTVKPIQWSDGDLELLGVVIKNRPTQDTKSFENIIEKMNNVSKSWGNRSLTLIGKAMIINVLMSSLFTYHLSILPPISQDQKDQFYKVIKVFLWGKKRPKIPLNVLQNARNNGGIEIANIDHKQLSLHVNWIKKLHDSPMKWPYVYEWIAPKLQAYIWECNLSKTDAQKINIPNCHWKNILIQWARIHHTSPETKNEIKEQIIYLNSHIKIQGKVIEEKLYNANIVRLSDILNETNEFVSFNEVKNKTENFSWLLYLQIIDAIPKKWKQILKCENDAPEINGKLTVNQITEKCKPSRFVTKRLRDINATPIERYFEKWNKTLLNDLTMEEYLQAFKRIYLVTDITKLREFQYRLLLNKIFTNDILYKWKKVESENCNICDKTVKQTIVHLLIECNKSKEIWYQLKLIFISYEYNWSDKAIVTNSVHENPKHVINLVTLIAKQFIFQQKCLEITPNYNNLRREISFYCKSEYNNSLKNVKQLDKFNKKWTPVLSSYPLDLS